MQNVEENPNAVDIVRRYYPGAFQQVHRNNISWEECSRWVLDHVSNEMKSNEDVENMEYLEDRDCATNPWMRIGLLNMHNHYRNTIECCSR